MPSLKHSVPKYRKHRASGQALVTVNGRDVYLGPHGTKASRVEYDRVITEWLASGRSISFGQPEHQATINELLVDYLRHARRYYGTGTNSELLRITPAVRPLRRLYGGTPAIDFGPRQFKAVRETLIGSGASRSYVNASMRRITRMFRWAAADGRMPVTVPQSLAMVPGLRRGKTVARETDPVLPVADSIVEQTLTRLPAIVADMVRLQRLTGMRPAEVCMLRPCDLNRTGEIWEYRPPEHKTAYRGRSRIVCLGPQAQAILLKYLARDANTQCFRPCDSEAKRLAARNAARRTPASCGNTIGSNRKRKPKRSAGLEYSTGSYGRCIARACELVWPVPADIAKDADATREWRTKHRWTPNQLRHTAATAIRHKFGLESAQVVLGHSRADVTQVYAERDMTLAAHVARQIG